MKQYRVNEIFYSLQGEGVRAGTPNFFVRFTGCNLKCSVEPGPLSPGGFDCDTEFASGRPMTAQEILDFCRELSKDCTNVIFTGGEPSLQLDAEILKLFKEQSFFTCIETNGSIDLLGSGLEPLLDWITVSPKVAEHCVRQMTAQEVKYVRAHGQAIPKPTCQARHKLISPAFDGLEVDPKTMKWCIDLVRDNPEWRLSVQQHKRWAVR